MLINHMVATLFGSTNAVGTGWGIVFGGAWQSPKVVRLLVDA